MRAVWVMGADGAVCPATALDAEAAAMLAAYSDGALRGAEAIGDAFDARAVTEAVCFLLPGLGRAPDGPVGGDGVPLMSSAWEVVGGWERVGNCLVLRGTVRYCLE
ncbi:MAG: hypothetical protein FJX76_16560 [Armatimonadetes bacterium]|nr:hypothetical protein [Armatimonadota bacterium]